MADPIIDLQIVVSDKAPERDNFGIPLIAGWHTRFPDRVREYAQAKDMLTDGFTTADPEYQMALVLKAQNPAVRRFKVGRLALATFTHTVTLTPLNTTAGLVYPGEINGEDVSVTVAPSDTVALICDKLVIAATGIPGVTATDNTTHVTITGAAGKIVSFANMSEFCKVEDTTVVNAANLQADLNAILDEDRNWYGLALTINSADAIKAAALWTEANGKIFCPMTSDTEVTDAGVTDCIASQLVTLAYTRTALIYHPDIGGSQWANAAWLAINLAPDPGSYTPAFKQLTGVRTAPLRQGAKSALGAKRVTRYTVEYGYNVTYEGKTPSGRFFDVTRFIDWQSYTIEADAFALKVNHAKLGFTTPTTASVKGCVEGSLLKGIRAGGIDGVDTPPVVTVTPIRETTTADRANRIYDGVEFDFRLTGAMHGLRIRGNVSV